MSTKCWNCGKPGRIKCTPCKRELKLMQQRTRDRGQIPISVKFGTTILNYDYGERLLECGGDP